VHRGFTFDWKEERKEGDDLKRAATASAAFHVNRITGNYVGYIKKTGIIRDDYMNLSSTHL
jgi:hypothetical protein